MEPSTHLQLVMPQKEQLENHNSIFEPYYKKNKIKIKKKNINSLFLEIDYNEAWGSICVDLICTDAAFKSCRKSKYEVNVTTKASRNYDS